MKILPTLWRALRFVGNNILWIVYYRATIWDRMAYNTGIARGMHCKHIRTIGPQMTREVMFHPGRPPTRSFLTYRKFMQRRTP